MNPLRTSRHGAEPFLPPIFPYDRRSNIFFFSLLHLHSKTAHIMPPQAVNLSQGDGIPSSLQAPFTLSADSGTDLWRKPGIGSNPATHSFTAPILYHSLPLASLKRARLSFSGPWSTLYDQAGLCLILPLSSQGATSKDPTQDRGTRWIKTGIEFTHEAPHISTVSCDRWADWSLLPLQGTQLTVEIEREVKHGAKTPTLWVYMIENSERRPIREVTWVFEEAERTNGQNLECWVGAYVAKVNKSSDKVEQRLQVKFWDMQIEAWEGDFHV